MWTISVDSSDEYVISGPAGDSIVIAIEPDPANPDGSMDWTGWTWSGGVTTTIGGSVDYPWTIVDESTEPLLKVTLNIDDSVTADWTVGSVMYFGLRGAKGADVITFISGTVVTTQGILAYE